MPEQHATVGRALWSGTISFGLVSVPVELFSATRRAGISLRMLGPDGTPLARQYVCPKDETVLDPGDIERGVEVDDDEWVIVTDEELEKVAPRRSRDISLERFVRRDEVDPAYFVRSYFLVPGAEQTKAYRLLAETMESTGRAGIASFVMRGKAHALAILADKGILRAETLRFGDEVRSAKAVGLSEPCDVPAKTVQKMAKALKALAADELDEAELRDDQRTRLLELAQEKQRAGEDVVEVEEAAPAEDAAEGGGTNVVDLMALIKRRMGGESGTTRGAGRHRPPEHAPAKHGPAKAGRKTAAAHAQRAQSDDATSDDLEAATKETLLERARALEIPGRSKMNRKQLLASVRRAS